MTMNLQIDYLRTFAALAEMQRTVVGAPGMSKDAAAYYQGLFQKVFDSSPLRLLLNGESGR